MSEKTNAEELAAIRHLGEALRKLVFLARTSGGTGGPDADLMAACERAEEALSIGAIGRAMFTSASNLEGSPDEPNTAGDSAHGPDVLTDGGWYWVRYEGLHQSYETPAMYRADSKCFYSVQFSGIPAREVEVLGMVQRPAAPAPVVDEPVAWLRSMDSEPISDAVKRSRADGFYQHHSIPLYTRPAGDVLADAERYRWLRKPTSNVPISHLAARDPETYDAAVDAARAKGGA